MSASLPKIALEEAYLHPDDVAAVASDPEEFERVCAASALTPSYYRPVLERLGDFKDLRLQGMDDAGIEHTIVSLTSPGIQAIADPDEAVAKARAENDFLAEQVARHPARFSGFAALPLQRPDEAAAELRRAVGELGFKGVLVNGYSDTGGDPLFLDDPACEPVWTALCELDVPLYLHPRSPVGLIGPLLAGHRELGGATWAFGTETATHLVRLIVGGVFDRFPTAKVILGHLGEGLPSLLWRTQTMFELNPFDKRIEKTFAEYVADNIWLTTSGDFSDQALTNAILTVGADHLMFSVDYPYNDNAQASAWIDRAPISELDRRKITSGNARALFDLPG